jgi:protein tyrosine phosphatase (PTP) superfamily phosphohydrolase (DUF442 family)
MQSPIYLFHAINDRFATGGQPEAADFSWLKEQGYTAVVNLNTPSARNYLRGESEIVTDLGMTYVAHPLDCSVLSQELYEDFAAVLNALTEERVFVHCAGNVKSSAMMHIYRIQALHENPQAALTDLVSIGAGHEPKWFEFFRRMGAA